MNDDLVKGKSFVLLEYLQGFELNRTSQVEFGILLQKENYYFS